MCVRRCSYEGHLTGGNTLGFIDNYSAIAIYRLGERSNGEEEAICATKQAKLELT